ncbi:MAG: hypothetical protein JKY56_17815, partial [Kofleriaceae bacterium]|nr:hypothetical protein [Kofleriaceae bacterium]
MMAEIHRVLAPGGRIYIIDIVACRPSVREMRTVLSQKLSERVRSYKNNRFRGNLVRLVADKNWKKMLSFNPIRSEHEMRWYLESRYPKGSIEVLNIGMRSRILAFNSGPLGPPAAQ